MKVTLSLPEGGRFDLGKSYHLYGEVVGVEQEFKTDKQKLLNLLEEYDKENCRYYSGPYYESWNKMRKQYFMPLIRALIEKVYE